MVLWEDHYGVEVGRNKGGMNSRKLKTKNEALARAHLTVGCGLASSD
jgi:hypothetical protein